VEVVLWVGVGGGGGGGLGEKKAMEGGGGGRGGGGGGGGGGILWVWNPTRRTKILFNVIKVIIIIRLCFI